MIRFSGLPMFHRGYFEKIMSATIIRKKNVTKVKAQINKDKSFRL